MTLIYGHPGPRRILDDAFAGGRVHHAWIFSGPRGVGKFTTALAVAEQLLDPEARGPIGRGRQETTDTARLIDAGTHPDLHVIRKELALTSDVRDLRMRKLSNIPIDVLREHMIGGRTSDNKPHDAKAYLKPMMNHGKVFIVDEAELIDPTGQNALLKTLEEPPPATYLFLVTARPERLLPTIESRCQHVRFGPLDDDALAAWFDAASLDVSGPERTWIDRFCEGAPGLATQAARAGLYGWFETIAPSLRDAETGRFPAALGTTLGELIEGYADARVKEQKNASKDAANKEGASLLFQLLAHHLRDQLAATATRGDDPAGCLGRIERLRAAEGQLEGNVNLKQLLENLAVQWVVAGEVTATTGS